MKRFLPAGEGYAQLHACLALPIYSIRRHFYLYVTILYFAFLPATGHAIVTRVISNDNQIRPLTIGDKVSRNTIIGHLVADSNKEITARSLRGTATILDFWATWCGTCISRFPLLDSIQKAHGNTLSIVLINNLERSRDTNEGIKTFLSEYQDKFPDFTLASMISTPYFGELFPARFIPHYVWIDANGRVKAITDSKELTDENIKRLKAGLSLNLKVKEQ